MVSGTGPLEDARFAGRGPEIRLQEVEIAALVRLADVVRKHPAVAPAKAGRGRDLVATPALQFRLRSGPELFSNLVPPRIARWWST